MWHEIAVAACLVLVIEGIIPFISPRAFRAHAIMAASMNDKALRLIGLGSMLAGTALLYLFN
ncbi:MAG: DUF2065 domain-containing protein [Pseudomonadales bacterium]